MTKKQKSRILYPSWMTEEQIDLLRHAEKGELPEDVREKLKKALDPATPYDRKEIHVIYDRWDGREDKSEIFKFTDIAFNRGCDFFQREFGTDFGLALFFRFVNFINFPKIKTAEKRNLQIMGWLTEMKEHDKETRLKEKSLTSPGDFIRP